MVNVAAVDVPVGVVTVTSFVALTNVVLNALPFHFTVAPETKSAPFTVSVKATPPAVAEAGLKLVMVGTD
jgi:hypothetical protein